MPYQDWFTDRDWNCQSGEHCVLIRNYLQDPAKLTQDRIKSHDDSAARTMEEARQLIADLTEYRQALAARYALLETSPYRLRLELRRNPAWSGGRVSFDIRLVRRYEDGTETEDLHEHYAGADRRAALARFAALKQQHNGIEAIEDIARRSWER